MEDLRNEISENSKEIIRLLERRRDLAIQIGILKKNNKMAIRNREQELNVMAKLSKDKFTSLVLNTLFELSINFEVEKTADNKLDYTSLFNNKKYVQIRSSDKNLGYILSLILNPGSIIACKDREMCSIMSAQGHHIIDEFQEHPDIHVSINDRSGEIIMGDSELLISDYFIENKENIYHINIS
ncbi:MAG: chorismate mutase [Ferroplasma sp.]